MKNKKNKERVIVLSPAGVCRWCGSRSFFSPAFADDESEICWDAYLCLACDVFLSSNCGSSSCCYCAGRPERPSDLPYRKVITPTDWPPRSMKLRPTRRRLELEAREDEEALE